MSNTKSHPLEFDDADDDETNFVNIHPKKSTSSNDLITKTNESATVSFKPKPGKRIAPKRPDEISIEIKKEVTTPTSASSTPSTIDSTPDITNNNNNNNSKLNNFFIDIESVRWFYKGDKESSNSTNNLIPVQSSSNLLNENNSNENAPVPNDFNNNINGNNPAGSGNNTGGGINVHHISSKKWYMFNKWDSYNIEVEYRDMLSKKQSNIGAEPKLVQVLDGLYEVNLSVKKCFSIYWKSKLDF